jgi:hypothetical protein
MPIADLIDSAIESFAATATGDGDRRGRFLSG